QFLCDPPTTPETYTLSLHDALPISRQEYSPSFWQSEKAMRVACPVIRRGRQCASNRFRPAPQCGMRKSRARTSRSSGPESSRERSEEHTSELQSRFDLVCRLLLEKK